MDPVRFAVSRPYTVAVAVILALLFSVLALARIPVQLKPTVDAPIITVTTIYRGAGPVDVEQQITREIEDLLQGVDGLEKLTSSSVEGASTVALEYGWGVAKDRALVDVINKLSQLPDLPADAEEPVVELTDRLGETAMWIMTVAPYSPDRMRQLVVEQVEPYLERVPGVASLNIVGGEEREIRVLVDPESLAARGLTFDYVWNVLRLAYVDRRGGTVETSTRQFVVRTEGRSAKATDLERVVLQRGEGGTIRLGDVARVEDGYRETTSIVHSNGGDNVAIGVRREPGANVVTLIEDLEAEIARINARLAGQGVDMQLLPVYRDTTYLERALEFVRSNLLFGAVLSVVVLLAFLRSARSVLVVTLSIPISLVAVFAVMDAMGRTLNVISLAGLAFAAGMVVDNAIVVLENIFRHLEQGKRPTEAAVAGGREVWGGVLAATLTTIAVFVPILAIEEEAGQLFADLALAISAAVGLSLVVALTVVPTLAALLYQRGRSRDRTQPGRTTGRGPLARGYARVVAALVASGAAAVRTKVVFVAVVIAAAAATLTLVPPAGYLPTGNRNLIFFFGNPVPGLRPEARATQLERLERWLQEQPEFERYFAVTSRGFNGGGVVLKDEFADGAGLAAFQARMMPVCFSIPGFRSMIPVRSSLFRDSGKQFTVEITGSDLKLLGDTAAQLQQQLSSWPGIQAFGVQSDYVEGRPELRVQVDPHRAAELGMGTTGIGQVVETAIAGRLVGEFSDGGRDYDINLLVPPERIRSDDDLRRLPFVTATGARTTLGAVARVERTLGPESINRLERERAITLSVNLRPEAVLQAVMEDVAEHVVGPALLRLPPEYRIELGGSADKFSSTLASLTQSFWLAILITYLLLVALFRSWLQPLVILVSVPLAMSGGLLGVSVAHALSVDATFDLLSMLGFVILAGIVVNNAILIVHQTNNLIAAGESGTGSAGRRAALAEAARLRLRPILMSVTTTVFGMLPLAVGRGAGSELYQGLAAVVVGGLLVSTVFTLLLVPALVSLGWDAGDAWSRRAGVARSGAVATPRA